MNRNSLFYFLALASLGLITTALAASVTVSPATASAPTGGLRTFYAIVSGVAGGVYWEVDGKPGGDAQVGTVTPSGVYTAPAVIATAPMLVTLIARSLADSPATGTATVTVRHPIPWITQVTPSTVMVGNFALDVYGSRFVSGAKVYLDGVPMTTVWIDASHLSVSGNLPASAVGVLTLRVDNPGNVASTNYTNMVAIPAGTGSGADAQTVAAVRFLEQASFGPTATDLDQVKTIGAGAWLLGQMAMPETPIPDGLDVNHVEAEVFKQMASAPDQLRQRMAFALSQLFVVSANKNPYGNELTPWMRLLSRNAFGDFRTLMEEVTLSPTMGKYLDLANSMKPTAGNKAGADENYARELMQLFTLGVYKLDQDGNYSLDANGQPIPTYDQNVVRNLSLALTG